MGSFCANVQGSQLATGGRNHEQTSLLVTRVGIGAEPSDAIRRRLRLGTEVGHSLIVMQLCGSHIAARQALMTRPYPMVNPALGEGHPPGVSALINFRLTNSFSLVGWAW